MSVEPYLLFGRLCLKAKLFTAKELRQAVTKQFNDQKDGKKKLFGEVCIELGLITEEQRDEILKKQASEEIHPEATVFGQLAILNGFVTKEHVAKALEIQKEKRSNGDKKRIGEILYAEKLMAPIQVRSILKAQHRIRQGIRSTMYLNRELLPKDDEKPKKEASAEVENIDADDLDTAEDKGTKPQSQIKEQEKSATEDKPKSDVKPKKPSIDEIENKLKNLENDFGGMFEVSIDEDDAEDVFDESEDITDGVIEPKMLDNEIDEDVFKIHKSDQEMRRSDQQKLREMEENLEDQIKLGEQNLKDEIAVSNQPTEYLADHIIFEQVSDDSDDELDSTLTASEREFLDSNTLDPEESQLEIVTSDGTTIRSNPESTPELVTGTELEQSYDDDVIPLDENGEPFEPAKKDTVSGRQSRKQLFMGRVGDSVDSLDVELERHVQYGAIILLVIAGILLAFTGFVIISNVFK